MMKRPLQFAQWFDICFKPRVVVVIKGTYTNEGKKRGTYYWKGSLFY